MYRSTVAILAQQLVFINFLFSTFGPFSKAFAPCSTRTGHLCNALYKLLMELPPDIETEEELTHGLVTDSDDEELNYDRNIELPPDIETEEDDDDDDARICAFFAYDKKGKRGCSCKRQCFSHIDQSAIEEIRGHCTSLSEVENVQRRWNLVHALCCDADGSRIVLSKMHYTIRGIEVPIRHSARH